MIPRGRFQGVAQIVRFNWAMYVIGLLALLAGGAVAAWIPLPKIVQVILVSGLACAGFWLITSLLVSHYVYDRSALYRGRWLKEIFPEAPQHYATLHVGLDEFSEILREIFPRGDGLVIDIFDPTEMTEPSIQRAREEQRAKLAKSIKANFRQLPMQDDELDAVFLIFSAHELRKTSARLQLFREASRVLKPDGKIVLVEHLRDCANFIAFGPGFLHFHSRAEWLRCCAAGGLRRDSERCLTRFVRCFVLSQA